MIVRAEPTDELWLFRLNGTCVPFRIWTGRTDGGATLDMYVLSVVPKNEADRALFDREKPSCLYRTSMSLHVDGVDSPLRARGAVEMNRSGGTDRIKNSNADTVSSAFTIASVAVSLFLAGGYCFGHPPDFGAMVGWLREP